MTDRMAKVTRRPMIEGLLGVGALLLLLAGCFLVVRPFLSAFMWALVLAFSLWPLQQRFTQWFHGMRGLAAFVVTLLLSLVLVGPFLLIGFSVADDARALGMATKKWIESVPAEPPSWLERVPIVGNEAAGYWRDFATARRRWMEQLDKAAQQPVPRAKIVVEEGDKLIVRDAPVPGTEVGLPGQPDTPGTEAAGEDKAAGEVSSRLAELLGRAIAWARSWLISGSLAIGQGVTQVVLSVFLLFFLLRHGEVLAGRMKQGIGRIAGERGAQLMEVAGKTVRGVVYGIMGTAFVQAALAGVGFWLAGVPGAVLLAALTFFFSPVPVGPPLIWIPATVWLFSQGQNGWGVFLALWGTFGISGVDNIVKPYIISQGSKLPFVLVFCGVIGGALAFGVVGVFLGPTLLAVVFRMVELWLPPAESAPAAEAAG